MARSDNSDIFISYRRLNIDFAQKLEQALRKENFEIWVDLEDIAPASPSYLADIYKGIEGADIFIPVLSPDYTNSKNCLDELRYALENNKRIIPIVYEKEVDIALLPDGAKNPNWVYFCEHLGNANAFDTAFPQLMEGILLNRDYTSAHTRYLGRAKQWEADNRHEDALLDGSEITKAEAWLVTETNTDPRPTPLQAQYILASRLGYNKKIEKRRRDVLGLVLLGLVAVVLLLDTFINSIDLAGEDNLRTVVESHLQAGADYVIEPDMLYAYKEAVYQGNQADIESLSPIVEDYLLWLEAFYPDINSYIIDIESSGDKRLIASLYEPMLPVSGRAELSAYLVCNFYKDDNFARWAVGELDIQTSDGYYAGTLVMEYRDPLADVQSGISSTFGFVVIGVIVIFVIYVVVYLRGMLSNWISRRRNPAAKLAATKSE